ncbi:glutamic-type intramembrane protease PrsW [Thalassobacillus sp. C254]|uniref:glutamic-type intramembrane protease PrsW n=1 Tax=Thalassobacillus sp. C254 TaxID=1225341 RepID=UPI000A9E50AB|nr:glutamic-type intramembrane protease PrsW [Thalassobacillus sp. C254]
MTVVTLFTAALAPAISLLVYFYLRNQYGSNMIGQVIKAFIIGVLLVFPVMVIQYALEGEALITEPWFKAFVSAAFLEEFFQWFLLYFIAYRFGTLKNRYDGIVYAVSLSLGFAAAENVLYLMATGIDFAVGRAFLPVSSHALFGVVMGYYLGSARFKVNDHVKKWLFLALIIPVVLHGFFDLILLTINQYLFTSIAPFMIFLWWFALTKVKKANERTE